MKVAVFVDFWNLQLTLNQVLAGKRRVNDHKAQIDWKILGSVLAKTACSVLGRDPTSHTFEGCYIYTSYNPNTDEGKKYKRWVNNFLDRQPGNNVDIRERKPKSLPRCPACHKEIRDCPYTDCGKPIVGTIEKGVDTLIVTDLIRLAFSNSYDVAVLASSDADMIPAVKFVQTTGKKVIQAGFHGIGKELGNESWGSIDVSTITQDILRSDDSH